MNIAMIFPGQGAQSVGMDRGLCDEEKSAYVKKELGEQFFTLLAEGPEDVLKKTRWSQLAIFLVSASLVDRLKETCLPSVVAGLSLGEYTALYAASCLSFEETFQLIKQRASLMEAACEENPGSMSAVIGMDPEEIARIIAPCEDVSIANYNTPLQTVLAGSFSGLKDAQALLSAQGAKTIPLSVEGAFHSPFMEKAREGLIAYIDGLSFQKPACRLFMNVPGQEVSSPSLIKEYLIDQVTSPVRWTKIIQSLKKEIHTWIEVGPGKKLSAMNGKMGVLRTYSVQEESQIGEVLEKVYVQ